MLQVRCTHDKNKSLSLQYRFITLLHIYFFNVPFTFINMRDCGRNSARDHQLKLNRSFIIGVLIFLFRRIFILCHSSEWYAQLLSRNVLCSDICMYRVETLTQIFNIGCSTFETRYGTWGTYGLRRPTRFGAVILYNDGLAYAKQVHYAPWGFVA